MASMLLEPLASTIETIKGRISTHGPTLRENETRTRMALIDPLLQALGWDTTDPALVTPEYRVDVGWADYALRSAGNKPAAVIEAKRLGSIVENHLDQAVGYCIQQGIAYAGVTDGSHWQLYRTFEPVPLVEKLVLDVSIAGAPAHEAALKLLLLWRPNLASGQSVEANSSVLLGNLDVSPELSSIIEPSAIADSITRDVTADKSADWTPLPKVHLVTGQGRNLAPREVRFNRGESKTVSSWAQMHIEVADWLVRNGRVNASHFPIRGLGFINSIPQGPSGRPFGLSHQISGGIYLNIKMSASSCVNNSKKLLTHFVVGPETVELKF